tara:strand:- start:1839 stop:2000 length:162 start_codon:yes stop_codon:yes gene_type:complete
MRKFKVEHNDYEKPLIYVMLYKPPYENGNILHKTGWKEKDVTITEIKHLHGEE